MADQTLNLLLLNRGDKEIASKLNAATLRTIFQLASCVVDEKAYEALKTDVFAVGFTVTAPEDKISQIAGIASQSTSIIVVPADTTRANFVSKVSAGDFQKLRLWESLGP